MLTVQKGTPRLKAALTPSKRVLRVSNALKKGDLIFTGWSSKKKPNLARGALYNLSAKLQKTPYTHVGMYIGNGRVVEANPTGGAYRVNNVALKDRLKATRVVAYRPKTDQATVGRAVKHMKGAVGLRTSLPRFYMNAARSQFARKPNRDAPVADNQIICSSLISRAYEGKLNQGRGTRFMRPVDLMKAKGLKRILRAEA